MTGVPNIVEVAHTRGLVATGDRRGEAIILQVGSENDALHERFDRAGAGRIGGHCAARESSLDDAGAVCGPSSSRSRRRSSNSWKLTAIARPDQCCARWAQRYR